MEIKARLLRKGKIYSENLNKQENPSQRLFAGINECVVSSHTLYAKKGGAKNDIKKDLSKRWHF